MISAASGTGKTSLIKALLDRHSDLHLSISHTTRPMRLGEVDGVNYHFIDCETFLAMRQASAFLESAEVFGNFYGTSLAELEQCRLTGKDVILEIDWQGADQVRARISDSVSIFILPPSLEDLRQRLEQRSADTFDVIQKRLAEASSEIAHYASFNYLIVNQDFNQALDQLSAIIQAERALLHQAEQRLAVLLSNLKSGSYS